MPRKAKSSGNVVIDDLRDRLEEAEYDLCRLLDENRSLQKSLEETSTLLHKAELINHASHFPAGVSDLKRRLRSLLKELSEPTGVKVGKNRKVGRATKEAR
jgi:hypothetical protein